MLAEKRNDPDFKEEESLSLSELRKKAAGKLAGKVRTDFVAYMSM